MIFIDYTSRKVDLGLYAECVRNIIRRIHVTDARPRADAGACDCIYDKEIRKWDRQMRIQTFVHGRTRRWIIIQLETAPESLTMEKLKADNRYTNVRCEPGIDIMQYFKDRDALVQTLMLLKPHVTESDSVPDAAENTYITVGSVRCQKSGDSPTEKKKKCLHENSKLYRDLYWRRFDDYTSHRNHKHERFKASV